MKSKILSSSTLTGQDVHNMNNENIGEIKDLMIDPNNGEIVYAVLSFGGFMGIGNKLFAIPMEALQFQILNIMIQYDWMSIKRNWRMPPALIKTTGR